MPHRSSLFLNRFPRAEAPEQRRSLRLALVEVVVGEKMMEVLEVSEVSEMLEMIEVLVVSGVLGTLAVALELLEMLEVLEKRIPTVEHLEYQELILLHYSLAWAQGPRAHSRSYPYNTTMELRIAVDGCGYVLLTQTGVSSSMKVPTPELRQDGDCVRAGLSPEGASPPSLRKPFFLKLLASQPPQGLVATTIGRQRGLFLF